MARGVFIFWSIFVAAALVRVIFSLQQPIPDIGDCLKQTVKGVGVISQEPERKEGGQVFIVETEQLRVASTSDRGISCGSGVLIRMKTKLYPRFTFGDHVSFTGKLSQPFNFKSDSGRAFDYKGYLAKDDIYYEIKSATTEKVIQDLGSKIQGQTPENYFENKNLMGRSIEKLNSILFYLKRRFVANLERTLGEPHSALAAGLVVGEKSALGKDLLADFRIVGLIHIVVLSGFNITVVGDAMRRMLSFLPRIWGISVGGIGIGLFGIMVGGGATVVRSCFMAGIALSADLIRRDYDVTRALIFAGLIMLIQNPMILLHDPSFQLSFLATLGLILLASPIEKKLGFIPEKFGMRGIVASTIATQIFVSPYILYMMGTMSIIGMVVNILVLPIIPATMLFVFLTGASGFIWMPLAQFFAWISHLLLSYELHMVEWFARVPYASIAVPIFSKWWVAGFYTAFAVVFVYLKYSNKTKYKDKITTIDIINYRNELTSTVEELSHIEGAGHISKPNDLLYITQLSEKTVKIMEGVCPDVYISRRAIKHIIDRRGQYVHFVCKSIPSVLENPTKIVDNSVKRKNSYLLAQFGTKIVGVVLDTTKTPDKCQVVSAFLINQRTYEKLIDISGRAEFPPFELSP